MTDRTSGQSRLRPDRKRKRWKRCAASCGTGSKSVPVPASCIATYKQSDNFEIRRQAVGLGQLQTDAAMSALLVALADEVNTVRNLAERSLLTIIEVVREDGVEQLTELLNHPVPLTRSPAARLLGMTHDPRPLTPFLKILQTDDQWLGRMWAAKALGHLGMTEAFDALAEALKTDDTNRVRAAAAEAIGKLRAPMSAELLKLALEDQDGGVRKIAEESLSALGQAGFEDESDPFSDD